MDGVEDESFWCEQVFKEFEFSVVRLHSGGDFKGNGFVVHGGDGETTCHILTCRHVLGSTIPVGGTMAAYFSGSIDVHYDATVLYMDDDRDLALLRAPEVLEPVTPLRFFDQAIVSGWNIVALSFITMGADAILEPGTFSGEITYV
jgi:S1-C subfamily serine protease